MSHADGPFWASCRKFSIDALKISITETITVGSVATSLAGVIPLRERPHKLQSGMGTSVDLSLNNTTRVIAQRQKYSLRAFH